MLPLRVIFSALVLVVPTGKPAAFAVFQTEGDAVNADVVDHSAVVVSQVPLVYGDVPLLSQYQTAADAVCANNTIHAIDGDNASRGLRIIGWTVRWSWMLARDRNPAVANYIVVKRLG
jgi:hypothetical protein